MEPREIIQSGVGAWNSWRIDKPSYAWGEYDLTHLCAPAKYRLPISRPDLTRIDLSGHDLRHVNFEGCILSKASLRGADMSGASLSDADLSECDLRSTCLREARGTNVTFRGGEPYACKPL